MPDYSAAIEAATRAISAHWNDRHGNLSRDRQRALAVHALASAAPIIEQQVREQVAADLEAVDPVEWALAGQYAGRDAARIARQGTA